MKSSFTCALVYLVLVGICVGSWWVGIKLLIAFGKLLSNAG